MRTGAIAGLFAGFALMGGCASAEGAEPAAAGAPGAATEGASLIVALEGASWIVFEIGGKGLAANATPTMRFEKGRVAGTSGCNRFTGGYSAAAGGQSLSVGRMASTMMACLEPRMVQETGFLEVLGAVERFAIEGDVLTLTAADGRTIRARRQP